MQHFAQMHTTNNTAGGYVRVARYVAQRKPRAFTIYGLYLEARAEEGEEIVPKGKVRLQYEFKLHEKEEVPSCPVRNHV